LHTHYIMRTQTVGVVRPGQAVGYFE
jgi:hypothetical protein